ncbi:MAG: low specificity L-threonine aldolase [Clostridia bacterium]|nr:low specificity L-threonine aldolase [Clostridia bacterium]
MERLSFECDYNEGAHEKILEALARTNREHLPGYGADFYCARAKEKIRAACDAPDADVFFLVGGTQTNKTVIDALLANYQGVVSAATGHIAAHEAGAIEATGHKVLALPHREGKLEAATLRAYLENFYYDDSHDHMVFPGMVYISHPTEYGTLYSKDELCALSEVCRQYELPLFLDGARLGYGLVSEGTDVTLSDLAALCDVFYIGGTKVGALCGEAVVFSRGNAPRQFMTIVKQNGALMAKGRLLGIQFDTLFTDNLYLEISRHAIVLADRLRRGFAEKGYEFYYETVTNQIFVILDDAQRERLGGLVTFSFWERLADGRTVVRFATSWATEEADVEKLIEVL